MRATLSQYWCPDSAKLVRSERSDADTDEDGLPLTEEEGFGAFRGIFPRPWAIALLSGSSGAGEAGSGECGAGRIEPPPLPPSCSALRASRSTPSAASGTRVAVTA